MGSLCQRFFTIIVEPFLIVTCFLVFLIVVLPVITLISSLLYLWRLTLIGYVKWFRPDIIKIMGGKNPVLSIDDLHNRPLCTIVGMGAFDCDNVQHLREFAVQSVFSRDPSTGELIHPEGQRYYFQWMGFFWWKWEENFNIEDHITIWKENKNEPISEEEFIKIIGILEASPFSENKSPWEAVLIGNVMLRNVDKPEKPKTIIVFRFHHGLADGVAILRVFMRAVFQDDFHKVVKPKTIERSLFAQKMHEAGTVLSLPYHFIKQGIEAIDFNAWHLSSDNLTRKIYKAWSSRIQIETIKEIKAIHGVGFTAVLISAVSGALRKMMIRCNVPVPKKMHALVPLPWPGHPEKLENHWSYCFLELNMEKDVHKRLLKTQRYIEKMKHSVIPGVNFAILKFANLLPIWVIKRVMLTNYCPSVILSNFPGPPKGSVGVGGFPLVDTMFCGGPLTGNMGISITILSYDGGLRIVSGVDSKILPTQELMDEFMKLVETEFQEMKFTNFDQIV